MPDKSDLLRIPLPKRMTPDAIMQINRKLFKHNYAYPVANLGLEWIVDQGEYTGTVTRRLARYFYKNLNIKIAKGDLEAIGQIARQSLPRGNVYAYVDFTRDLSWERGTFGDGTSCFWTSKADAKTMLLSDPTFSAMRLWFADGSAGLSRCWTVQRAAPDGTPFTVLFNAYGKHQLNTLAIVLATWMNTPVYGLVKLRNLKVWDGMLHINGGNGYAVGHVPTDLIDLNIREPDYNDRPKCAICKHRFDLATAREVPGYYPVCPLCWVKHFRACQRCNTVVTRWYDVAVDLYTKQEWCSSCTGAEALKCVYCQRWIKRALYNTALACPHCGHDPHSASASMDSQTHTFTSGTVSTVRYTIQMQEDRRR